MQARQSFALVLLGTLVLDVAGLMLLDVQPLGACNLAGRFAICFAAGWAVPRGVTGRHAVLPIGAAALLALLVTMIFYVETGRSVAGLGGPAMPLAVSVLSATAALAGWAAASRRRASPAE